MRLGAICCAGIVCVLAIASAHCGGKAAPAAPSAPSSPSTPTPSPSPSPAPAGTFTVTCGTTAIDLAWSGVDTRACTITSANGFDGDVALSCSGLPSASCELDPPSVRVAPERAGSSTLKISYSEGMPFGVFDATATGTAGAGSTTATTTVSVQRDGNSITRHCPSAADVAAIDSAVLLVFEHDPTAGKLVCLASEGSRDLTYLKASAYQGLSLIRHITFSAPLPWTSGTMWQWFTSSVRGIRFRNQNFSSCCESDRMISMGTILAAAHPEQVIFSRLTDLTGGFLGVTVHETRHANGKGFPHCAGSKDRNLAELGGIAVTYHLNRLLADSAPAGFTTAQERIGLLAVARNNCQNNYCEPQSCSF